MIAQKYCNRNQCSGSVYVFEPPGSEIIGMNPDPAPDPFHKQAEILRKTIISTVQFCNFLIN